MRILVSLGVVVLLVCAVALSAAQVVPPRAAAKVEKVEAIPLAPALKKEEPKKAAQEVVKKAVIGRVVQPNLEPIIQQYLPRMRTLLRGEVHFLRKVCEPSPEQLAALSGEEERILKEATKTFVEAIYTPRPVAVFPGNNPVRPSSQQLLVDALSEYAKTHFTAAQAEHFQAECAARKQRLQELAVRYLVLALDRDLLLTAEQREKIAGSLTAKWDENWARSASSVMYYPQYFPNVPDALIVPHLDENQKKVWASRPKNQGIIFNDFGPMTGITIQEDDAPAEVANPRAFEKKAAP